MKPTPLDNILETATADCFWVPPHVQVVEREAIKYTHSPQPSVGYNRVVRVRPNVEPPEVLLEEVLDAHEGGSSRWHINPMGDNPRLRRALTDAGYAPGHRHFAYGIRTDAYDRKPASDIEVHQVASVDDLRALYEIRADVFGRNPDLSNEDLAREVDACTGPERRVARFLAYRKGELAGACGLTFFDELSFGLVWAGGVLEAHRGHGVYTALLAARARAAKQRGIEWLGLYAREETSAPIVAAQGFERHGYLDYFERESTSLRAEA
ncbi:GNAT family N-acetyltransferase [Persicimonas caeni]|uniref:GNAT family N-acetyltransferase n=1 Tax=Persicimonas caeni TaxID=2292766 RepID=A0A4Y6Q053_PERCE|nr:GNAT family N-acetyltransferase [Persicimonas caeni]QDG53956.1 GNAT family N-acetyltransferase [Persicimonas caeni]QED35177.1 GNAT family N-acetyltransferase [Persicimonas caeni]